MRPPLSSGLPGFPWDVIAPIKATAAAHPDGLVDLSMGSPVDPVPEPVRAALAGASNVAGYPLTAGTPDLRAAIAGWVATACAASGEPGVLPTVGSKELVAWLPTLLGVGPGDAVVIPTVCYPTYEVGVRLAGATVLRTDTPAEIDPALPVRMAWVNSPSNPTGAVRSTDSLRGFLAWGRERGVPVVSDECYLTLGWEETPGSMLADEVCGADYTGVLALHSLSKRSNLAGYRAGTVSGDRALIAELLEVRKHAGMIVPAPVQAAMAAALRDEEHVDEQRARYARRRTALRAALEKAEFSIEHSGAGLYLWATRGEDCWQTMDWLAARGILASPGALYGDNGARYVRFALTATDERIEAAAGRLVG